MKKSTLKTRQQRRKEKRRARRQRDLFTTGLEAIEIPTPAILIDFTPTEILLYQVMLANSDRNTGRIGRVKVDQYMKWTETKSRTSIYAALAGLNSKGLIETEVNGWVTGTVKLRFQNKENTEQLELPGLPLERALVHREALKLMIRHKLAPMSQKVYWKLAADLDLQTGEIHFQNIQALADFFKCKKATIYKALRQINEAGLGSLLVDFGVEGHLEHVALAYGIIQLAIARKKEKASGGSNARHADQKFTQFKQALYDLFGVPIEALNTAEIKTGINALDEVLERNFSSWKEVKAQRPAVIG